jgi:lipid-binding SYLF domain-containing protein
MRSNLQWHRGLADRWLPALAMAALVAVSAPAWARSEQQELVDASRAALADFIGDPDMAWLHDNLGRAKAVLIAPAMVRAGWIFGGAGGRAVVFAKNGETGRWVGPAFYNVGAASVGFQAGVAVSETMTLVMTERGLASLLASSARLGEELSVAAGPVGVGTGGDITSDFVAYSRSKGIYGGFSLEGSVISVNDSWNQDYYGTAVLPSDILVRPAAGDGYAGGLMAALIGASSPRGAR